MNQFPCEKKSKERLHNYNEKINSANRKFKD